MRAAFPSLTSRLVLVTVGLVALVSILLGLATTLVLRNYLMGQLDDKVDASLQLAVRAEVNQLGGPGVPPPDPDHDNDYVRGQGVNTLNARYVGSTAYGRVLTSGQTQGGTRFQELTASQLSELQAIPTDGHPQTVSLDGLGDYRVSAVGTSGNMLLVGLPTSEVDDTISRLVVWELALVLSGTVAAGAAGALVVRRQLRPLREVAGTAHRVAALPLASGEIELAERVPDRLTDARTEIGQVGAALNTLLAHVESSLHARHESEQQVRQFVADASHELRTPLTTIAGYTELARRRPDDVATVGTALGKVQEESARMTSMVEDLLLLARLDAGRPLARDRVDLSRLLVEAVSDARVVAPDHRWRLELPEESIEVTGDADRLHQVVTNLLTNAQKYTPAGTTVTVTARRFGFSVHDDGPGFPPGLVDTAFERFARGDASRTRTSSATNGMTPGAAGAGLGLSLVHAIVSAHGGTVSLDSHPGSTTLTVTLPG
ncbi:MAG TPA: HAMP domain-containing sensor histidine kinase [Nocardioides sp.]|jgi:two-component system OmpR family sensor kinase|nr:HAMP domain-containing sensor histidine kinase [Nocardioides sp.]